MFFAHLGFGKVFLVPLHVGLLLVAFSADSRAQSTFVPIPTQFINAAIIPAQAGFQREM